MKTILNNFLYINIFIGTIYVYSYICKNEKISVSNIEDTKNNNDMLDEVKRITNSTFLNTNKNTKGLVYLGIFVFLSQVIVTSINNYLMLFINEFIS